MKHRESLASKVAQFLEDPTPGDLTAELALMRALLQDYLDRFTVDMPLPFDDITRIVNLIESVGRMVERIARILNQTALTQVEVQYLQARIADLIVKYIDDVAQQRAFLAELSRSLEHGRGNSKSYALMEAGGDAHSS